jgi:hypothetical protein
MKLNEIKTMQGTYVGLRVLPESATKIKQFCEQNGIKIDTSKFEDELHTTVIYSRKVHNIQPEPLCVHACEFLDFEIFSTDDGKKVLVIRLNAPSVVARHLKLMAEHDATYDFPVYQPHVSLCYDYEGDVTGLPLIDFPIFLGNEYVEPLDLDWGK